jgi:hypothetical protein
MLSTRRFSNTLAVCMLAAGLACGNDGGQGGLGGTGGTGDLGGGGTGGLGGEGGTGGLGGGGTGGLGGGGGGLGGGVPDLCGSTGGDGGGGSGPTVTCGAHMAPATSPSCAGNPHVHALGEDCSRDFAADAAAMTAKTYSLTDTYGCTGGWMYDWHAHSVTFTGGDFASIALGNSVSHSSTVSLGHSHEVEIGCSGPLCMPSCAGKSCGEGDGCGKYCTGCPPSETCNELTWQCGPHTGPQGAVQSCVNAHWYRLVEVSPQEVDWATAQSNAEALGGHLVTITSVEEQEWLMARFALAKACRATWIGATDEAVEGQWTWVSGEPWGFTNWHPGEPNDGDGEDWAELYWMGTWNDLGATATKEAYVVEWDP